MTSETWDGIRAIRQLVADIATDLGEWQDDGACRDHEPNLWFSFDDEETKQALAICRRCPVRIECKAFAVADPQDGIWGGTTEKERRAIRRSPARREYLFSQLRKTWLPQLIRLPGHVRGGRCSSAGVRLLPHRRTPSTRIRPGPVGVLCG